jgi:Mg-chelatase subunit ChlD
MIARRGKISLLAAGLSAAVHLTLLGGLATVRSDSSAESKTVLGAVSVQVVGRTIEQPLITPKPQVKMESKPVAQQSVLPASAISQAVSAIPQEKQPHPAEPLSERPSIVSKTIPETVSEAASSTTPSTDSKIVSGTVSQTTSSAVSGMGGGTGGTTGGATTTDAGFFGQETAARTVCFVVDCSGSMYGRRELIRRQLKNCIASLHDTQSFYLIFFMDGDKLLESGDGKALPATGDAKAGAFEMIDHIRLEGQTNARQALERAMKIRDGISRPVQLIYFLTDGFDLQISSPGAFCRNIGRIRDKYASSVTINTIGLWASAEDQRTLRKIAEMTGGQFMHVDSDN